MQYGYYYCPYAFAFIFPYLLHISYAIYNNVTKATVDFENDFLLRAITKFIAISNPAVNFVLYLVQLKNFRTFVKKLFTARSAAENLNPVGVDNQEIKMQAIP